MPRAGAAGGPARRGALRGFWDQTRRTSAARDRASSVLCSCLMIATLLYNVSVAWRLRAAPHAGTLGAMPVGALRGASVAGACCVLAHLLLETAYGHLAAGPFYLRHRTACVAVGRTVLLLFMLAYIPFTFSYTLAWELQAGRHEAATYRMLIAFVAVHAIEVLCFRLPVRAAAPYHLARLALGFSALPATLRAFERMPDTARVACELWARIGHAHAAAAAHVLGPAGSALGAAGWAGAGAAGGGAAACAHLSTRAQLSAALALLVYLQLGFGVLVPLYCLAVMEDRDFRAWLGRRAAGGRSRSGSGGSSGASSGGGGNGSGDSITSSGRSAGGGLARRHGSGSRAEVHGSSSGTAAAAEAAAASLREVRARPGASGGAGPSAGPPSATQLPRTSSNSSSSSTTDDSVDGAAGPAQLAGEALLGVWPQHFGLFMHASLALAATGAVWAGVGLAVDVLQRRGWLWL